MKKMYRIGIAALTACIFVSFITSCGFDNDTVDPGPITGVSLYHASPNAPDLDILVDDIKINTVPFKYGYNTDYLRFSSGNRNIKFRPYGGGANAIDTVLTFEPEKDFSVFVVDTFEQAKVFRIFDDPSPPAAGNCKVRFINLSPDSEPVQLKIKGVTLPLTVGQSFMEASGFMDLSAVQSTFEILSGGVLVDEIPDVQLQSGWFYTILVRGYANPPVGNTNVIETQVVIN